MNELNYLMFLNKIVDRNHEIITIRQKYLKLYNCVKMIRPKTLKMVLDTSLLSTQQYKVHIKGKVEQSRGKSSALPYTSV